MTTTITDEQLNKFQDYIAGLADPRNAVLMFKASEVSGLIARLRAAEKELEALRPKPKYLAKDDPARKCHAEICWACDGTGISQRPDITGICDMNDKIPF